VTSKTSLFTFFRIKMREFGVPVKGSFGDENAERTEINFPQCGKYEINYTVVLAQLAAKAVQC
jgi:hypothetical protein